MRSPLASRTRIRGPKACRPRFGAVHARNRVATDCTIQSVSLFSSLFPGMGVYALARIPDDETILFEEYQFVDEKLVSIIVVYAEGADFDGLLEDVTLLNGEAEDYRLWRQKRIVKWETEKCIILLSEKTDGMPLPVDTRKDARSVLIIQDTSGSHRIPDALGL